MLQKFCEKELRLEKLRAANKEYLSLKKKVKELFKLKNDLKKLKNIYKNETFNSLYCNFRDLYNIYVAELKFRKNHIKDKNRDLSNLFS